MNELQLDLFNGAIAQTVRPQTERGATIAERFEAFHQANPQVFAMLRSLALGTKARGVRKWSIKAAFELLRWQYALQTRGEEYKLCNDYHSRYARLLMERVPELDGFFETRELRRE